MDRRVFNLLTNACNDHSVCSRICLVCAQMKTDIAGEHIHEKGAKIQYKKGSAITRVRGKWIADLYAHHDTTKSFNLNLDYAFFMRRYAEGYGDDLGPLAGCTALRADDWEWRRRFKRMKGVDSDIVLLCCPEDVRCSSGLHAENEMCEHCEMPICAECAMVMQRRSGNQCVPMGLCNDNMWGYASSLITKWKVRWIEAAAVLPCWTSMVVYYVEEDWGHLMEETIAQPRHRTAVRGHCFSCIMPWEDVLDSLNAAMSDADLVSLPREEECLKYMLRLHLRVGRLNMEQHHVPRALSGRLRGHPEPLRISPGSATKRV